MAAWWVFWANTSTATPQTWEALSRAQQAKFDELAAFTKSESNFGCVCVVSGAACKLVTAATSRLLREATRIAELPCYPYIGTYLGDLTFIDAGSADYTPDGLINWSKFQATANTLLQLQGKQKTPYAFELVPEWTQFLYHLPFDHTEQVRSGGMEPLCAHVFRLQEIYELSKRAEK